MTPTKEYAKKIVLLLSNKEKEIKKNYYDAILDIAAIASSLPYKNTVFNFNAYPLIKKRIDLILKDLGNKIESAIVNGIDGAWQLSDQKNTIYLDKNLKGLAITPAARKIYYDTNEQAREAFKTETIAGLKLSDRVWNLGKGFEKEIEANVAYGIANGESADSMARRMKRYLNKPDMVIRKIKEVNEKGQIKVRLSKRSREYHPGQGVYRSSYKNALRLAREEINRAYRKADHDRWVGQSFVVGVQISLSNNHKHLPGDVPEVCELLQGQYPKDFNWTGWHIQCMCHATPIFITAAEKRERRHAIINGETWKGESENDVKEVPKAFTEWVKRNSQRLKNLKNLPEFIKANKIPILGD